MSYVRHLRVRCQRFREQVADHGADARGTVPRAVVRERLGQRARASEHEDRMKDSRFVLRCGHRCFSVGRHLLVSPAVARNLNLTARRSVLLVDVRTWTW